MSIVVLRGVRAVLDLDQVAYIGWSGEWTDIPHQKQISHMAYSGAYEKNLGGGSAPEGLL